MANEKSLINMEVSIIFYTGFEKYLKKDSNKTLHLSLDDKEDIRSILNRFLPGDEIGFVGMVLVNKKITDFDYKVTSGDKIEVFPVIGGG